MPRTVIAAVGTPHVVFPHYHEPETTKSAGSLEKPVCMADMQARNYKIKSLYGHLRTSRVPRNKNLTCKASPAVGTPHVGFPNIHKPIK